MTKYERLTGYDGAGNREVIGDSNQSCNEFISKQLEERTVLVL
jgi:hypothetical protein